MSVARVVLDVVDFGPSVRFYLGTHIVSWLWLVNVPLFVSRRQLRKYKKLRRALGRWALDSGGFTELSMFGGWRTTPAEYVRDVLRFDSEIGGMDFASIQDWMCEPHILEKTGLSIVEHQTRTIDNYVELVSRTGNVQWLPVIQGWQIDDYLRHVDMYAARGIDLTAIPRVGVGSVCRRQSSNYATAIVSSLAALGLSLHGFGFKKTGLKNCQHILGSADSMAWSFAARHELPLDGHSHLNCANCLEYALMWLDNLHESLVESTAGIDYTRWAPCK
jgi:hypothetical protein